MAMVPNTELRRSSLSRANFQHNRLSREIVLPAAMNGLFSDCKYLSTIVDGIVNRIVVRYIHKQNFVFVLPGNYKLRLFE